jgi:hypothetical protein
VFPPHTDDFQKPIKFKSDLGNEFFGKKGEKPSEEKQEPKESPKPKPKQNPSIVSIMGGMGTLLSFASGGSMRRGWLERWPTRTGTILLVVCMSLGWCREVRVWCVPFTLKRGVSLCLKVSHHTEKVVGMLGLGVVSLLDIPSPVANTSLGNDLSFWSQRSYGCRAYSPGTHARKEEDGLLLEFSYNPTRTRSV